MSRSTWKLPFSKIQQKIQKKKEVTKRQVWSRASTVLPQHLGLQVFVHNGKNFIRVQVVEPMIGHKYGEFATTRKKALHKTKAVQRSSHKK